MRVASSSSTDRGILVRRSQQHSALVCLVVFLSRSTTAPVVAAATAATSGNAQESRPWSLPPLPRHHTRDFFDQCESLAVVLERLRGGSSYNQEEWRTPAATGRQNYEGREDGGGNDDYNDDDAYYYSGQRQAEPGDRYGSGRYDEDYDDYGRAPPWRGTTSARTGFGAAVPDFLKQGDRKIGLSLLASGLSFTLLGVALMFNRTIMRVGNLLFIAGVPMTLGPSRTVAYFVQPEKMRATFCLASGIFLVFMGRPFFGIALEIFGLLNLFGNMFPFLMVFLKQIPLLGPLLQSNKRKSTIPRTSNGRGRDDGDYDDYGGGYGYEDQRQAPALQPGTYDEDDYRDDETPTRGPYYSNQ